ncbi:MAG TPA: LuxR C-terminal-related transcriptional regulator [Natronosporangium sp.]
MRRSRHDDARRRDELVLRVHRADDVAEVLAVASTWLRRLVPFDAGVWFLTDPATGLPVAPTRLENVHEPDPEFCSRAWRWEFLSPDVSPLREIARAPVPAVGLRLASYADPQRSRRLRRLLAPMGVDDELRTVLRVGDSPWGAALLYRRPGRPRFTAREVGLVASLSAPLGEALRTRSRHPAGRSPAIALPEPGMLLFDPQGRLISADDRAGRWLAELPPSAPSLPTDCGIQLPVWLQAMVFRVAAAARGHGDGTARARLRTRAGTWLVCHASGLRSPDGQIRQVAVVIEPATATEITPIVVEAYDLSEREQQVTRLVARGAGTREIAAQLHLSVYTVQDYLKTIFRKVNVGSRGELVAKLYAEHFEPVHASGVTRVSWPEP